VATERFDIIVRARGTNQVNRKIKSIGTSANSTRKILALMRAALVIIASIQVIAGFTRLIDTFTEMRNKLRLLTDDTRVLATVQNSLFLIAQDTRTSFEAIGEVFVKTSRATLKMKLSFRELLAITKVLAQTVAISAVPVNTATAALFQFSQGLASGTLRGQELVSVAEGLPELARIIGKEFGVAGGELVAFAKANEGIITTERLIKALVAAIPELGEIFGKTQVTISQGFTRLNNALIFFLGGVNDATGVSKFLADGLTTIANNIDKVVLGLTVLTGIVVFNFLVGQVLGLIGTMSRLVTIVGIGLVGAFRFLAIAMIALINPLKTIRLLVLTNPLFLIGAVAILAVVGAFLLFENQIKAVVAELGGLRGIFNNVVAFFGSGIIVMIENWELLGTVIKNSFFRALNSIIEEFEIFLTNINKGLVFITNGVIALANSISVVKLPEIKAGTVTLGRIGIDEGEADASLSRLVKLFKNKFDEIKGADPAGVIKQNFDDLLAFLKRFTKDGAEVLDFLLDLLPKAGEETAKVAREFKTALSGIESLVSGLSPLADSIVKIRKVTEALSDARNAGIVVLKRFGLTEDEIIRRSIRNQLGAGNAVAILAEKTKLLNQAKKDSIITAAEEIRLLRDANIAALQLDESFSGQLTLTLLEFQKELSNLGELAGNVVVNAFQGAEDAIVKFVTTGKLEFSSLITSILADITRLAVRSAITGPLFELLDIGAPGGGILGSLLGAFGGGPTGAVAGAVGGAVSGPAGFPGFRTGGQFTVGGSGGADSQLIAFKATPGEEVTITRPDQRPTGRERGTDRPIQIVFNVTTPDADSFRKSQGQLLNEAFATAARANRRNS